MFNLRSYADERQGAWCIHCTEALASVGKTRDHVPTKSLLDRPFPDDLPVVPVCAECNKSFAADEAYFGMLLETVLSGSTDPADQRTPEVRRRFESNPSVRARLDRGRRDYVTLGGETRSIWSVENDRVRSVVVKNARGHIFFEYGEPAFGEPIQASFAPATALSKSELEAFLCDVPLSGFDGWAEVGSRMMQRQISGADIDVDGWIVVQDGRYRYKVVQTDEGFCVRSIIAEYLTTETFFDL